MRQKKCVHIFVFKKQVIILNYEGKYEISELIFVEKIPPTQFLRPKITTKMRKYTHIEIT